jgi:hypothetical protein
VLSYKHQPCQVVINKPEFNEIFNLARWLYAKIIDNPKSQKFKEFRHPKRVYSS